MPALPPPTATSPGGASPPGAPPGAHPPFRGTLEDHWARTATAEGQTEKPVGDRPGEAREHVRERPPHDLLSHDAAVAGLAPHTPVGSDTKGTPSPPQGSAPTQTSEGETGEAPTSGAGAASVSEATPETALAPAAVPVPVSPATQPAPASSVQVPVAPVVQDPGAQGPPVAATTPPEAPRDAGPPPAAEHGPTNAPAPGPVSESPSHAAQPTEAGLPGSEAATSAEAVPAAQSGTTTTTAATTQAAAGAPPASTPAQGASSAHAADTSEQQGDERGTPRPTATARVAGLPRSAQGSTSVHVPTAQAAQTATAQPTEVGAPQAQPASPTPGAAPAAMPVAAEAPSANLATATAEGTLLDSGVRMQEMIDSIHATVELASRQGLAHARIALEPAELGEIHVHLTQTRDGLVARLTADTPEAVRALLGGRTELADSLSSLGTSLLRLDIGSSGEFTAGEQRHEAHGGRAGNDARAEQQPDSTDTQAIVAGAQPSSDTTRGTLVDVLA
ncbi:MAG TPA: flagellar hook-length control protein FliK [Solirubrobacteraceae bacterium]